MKEFFIARNIFIFLWVGPAHMLFPAAAA